jgi:hypothetical protein
MSTVEKSFTTIAVQFDKMSILVATHFERRQRRHYPILIR